MEGAGDTEHFEGDVRGMKTVIFRNKPGLLFGSQTALHKPKIQILVSPVNFISDDRMTNVTEMNADLVLSASEQNNSKERENAIRTDKSP